MHILGLKWHDVSRHFDIMEPFSLGRRVSKLAEGGAKPLGPRKPKGMRK